MPRRTRSTTPKACSNTASSRRSAFRFQRSSPRRRNSPNSASKPNGSTAGSAAARSSRTAGSSGRNSQVGEAVALLLLVGAGLLWADSLRARERAVRAGRDACQRYGLQFLDETVSFARMRLARDAEGHVKIARTYTFEFSDTG